MQRLKPVSMPMYWISLTKKRTIYTIITNIKKTIHYEESKIFTVGRNGGHVYRLPERSGGTGVG